MQGFFCGIRSCKPCVSLIFISFIFVIKVQRILYLPLRTFCLVLKCLYSYFTCRAFEKYCLQLSESWSFLCSHSRVVATTAVMKVCFDYSTTAFQSAVRKYHAPQPPSHISILICLAKLLMTLLFVRRRF